MQPSQLEQTRISEHHFFQPPSDRLIHLLRFLPQSPVRSIDLFVGQMRDGFCHTLAQVCRKSGISECLDEEDWGGDAPVKDG